MMPPAEISPADANSFHGQDKERLGKGIAANPDGPLIAPAGVLEEDISLPVAVLQQSALHHNLGWMRDFVRAYGVSLAPHGKTSMCPALFHMQLQAGAWGITLATAPQVQVAHAHGVQRVLMANQLVGRGNMAIISRQLRDAEFSFCCVVDSAENARALGQYFSSHGQCLRVLLEIGVAAGRTGVRDEHQMQAVLDEIARWPQALALVGVEVYEGVVKQEAEVRALLQRTLRVFLQLRGQSCFAETPALLTGAGSAWFDVVAEEFLPVANDPGVEVVLRPGCYLTHDIGAYRQAAQRIHASNPIARQLGAGLRPALQVWAQVQSRPEPERVIVGMGKRDAAFDAGFPQPALHFRTGMRAPAAVPVHWQIAAMMDQHAFLQVQASDDLQVGDLLCFDISHPCLTFDKWRQLLLVDAQQRVVDVLPTYF